MRIRFSRWMAIGLIGAIGLYFVADVVALRYTESRAAAELSTALSAEEAKVNLGAVPFMPGFFSGNMNEADVRVRGATGPGGMRVHSFGVEAVGIHFSSRELFRVVRDRFGPRTRVMADEVQVVIELEESDLLSFLQTKLPVISDVRVTSAGVEMAFGTDRFDRSPPSKKKDEDEEDRPELPRARFLPDVESGVFRLQFLGGVKLPDSVRDEAQRVEELVKLPDLPEGLRSHINLGDRVIVLEASGVDVPFEIGEG